MDTWCTPKPIMDFLANYNLSEWDPCPYPKPEWDGLEVDWLEKAKGKIIYCNPPYHSTSKWVKKMHDEWKRGVYVIGLIPANRTDTTYWHEYVKGKAHVKFVQRKLKYINPNTDDETRALFPSLLVFYEPGICG